MSSEEAWSNYLLLLIFTVTWFLAIPMNSLAVSSLSLRVYQCNKCDMRNLHEQNFRIVFAPIHSYLNWSNFLIRRYRFPKRWNWQICHAHQAFKIPLCTFSGKLRSFPTVISKTIGFLLIKVCFSYSVKNSAWVTSRKELASSHYAAYSRVADVLPHMVHVIPLWTLWKLLEALCRTTSSVAFIRVASCFVERGKNKTVRNSTSLKCSIGTMIANVSNYILWSCIIYIDTTGFLFVVR